jgi:hypothetical protein
VTAKPISRKLDAEEAPDRRHRRRAATAGVVEIVEIEVK